MRLKSPKDLFSSEDIQAVRNALIDAEKQTSAEIVPVVAATSGRYNRAEDVFALLLSLVALGVLWPFIYKLEIFTGLFWSGPEGLVYDNFLATLLVIMVMFPLGAFLATIFPIFRLFFVPEEELKENVDLKASSCFHDFNIGHTSGGSGVLIYVSLYEHRVRILGDKSVSETFSQEDFDDICKRFTDKMKDDKPVEGLVNAIHRTGELLGHHLPRQKDDVNELPDKLYLID